jgi:3-hydroxymyristoyl/3-hydroxydecanoyl-(acyl carrier protein) dehydratase
MKIHTNPASVNVLVENPLQKMLAILDESMVRSTRIQHAFLDQQAQNLQTIAASLGLTALREQFNLKSQPIFTRRQLEEFGSGLIAQCFGPDFAILDTRKTPRIPNGDLLMIDHVLSIDGERGKLQPPASITSEFDIPADAWFLRENPYPGVPLGVLMEIALQPCGILSAYLGSSLILPEDVNTFRNLDGAIHFLACPSLAGKTVTQHARLLSSVFSSGMLIQKYAFELIVDNQVFLSGESSFGYFRPSAMEGQTGLDEAKGDATSDPKDFQPLDIPHLPAADPSMRHLRLLDELHFQPGGGSYGQGLIIGSRLLDGSEWFYRNHFYQDPVMPGSLGVETITQALWAFMQRSQPKTVSSTAQLDFSNPAALQWKYRGQVIPSNRKLQFEVHLKNSALTGNPRQVLADAAFRVDGRKIYAIENISLTLNER